MAIQLPIVETWPASITTTTWRQQNAALRLLAVVQLSDETMLTKSKVYTSVCFPDMKHILDNYMISDVRLTTGSNWSRNLGGQVR
jgi:hypothetical protein